MKAPLSTPLLFNSRLNSLKGLHGMMKLIGQIGIVGLFSLLWLNTAVPGYAQTPRTDLFLIAFEQEAGQRVLGVPRRISQHPGYNNQPAFTFDGRYVLFNADPTGTTDIFRYDLALDSLTQLTHTAVGEYSPTPTSDSTFVAVVVEPDGRQRLWEYPLSGAPSRLFVVDRDSVGYFDVLPAGDIAMFVLGTPPTLRLWNYFNDEEARLPGLPGRSIKRHPLSDDFVYVDKTHKDRNVLYRVQPQTLERHVLAQLPPGCEDVAFMPDGTLLASAGSMIYRFSPHIEGFWYEWADFKDYGLANISRMAVSPDGNHLVVVSIYSPPPAKAP